LPVESTEADERMEALGSSWERPIVDEVKLRLGRKVAGFAEVNAKEFEAM
jgi:hypothetical protein